MIIHTVGAQLAIYGLVAITCALGLPLFHYFTAVMIAVIWRHGRGPNGLLAPLSVKPPVTAASLRTE